MSKEKFITISQEMLRYFLTLIFAAIGTYVGWDRYVHNMQSKINSLEQNQRVIQRNIGNNNIGFLAEQQKLHGIYINRLIPNQISLAKDCNKRLLFNFNDIRGDNNYNWIDDLN